MMQSLATLKLLAGGKLDSPLLGLMFLLDEWVIELLEDSMAPVGLGNSSRASLVFLSEQGVTESLMKMRFPPGQVARPWEDLFVETLGRPRIDPLFVSSVNAKLRMNASVYPQEKDNKGHTSGWGIGRF
jgi:hypothetical protein